MESIRQRFLETKVNYYTSSIWFWPKRLQTVLRKCTEKNIVRGKKGRIKYPWGKMAFVYFQKSYVINAEMSGKIWANEQNTFKMAILLKSPINLVPNIYYFHACPKEH